MPINDNDYSCHITGSYRTCLTNRMRSISCHITPLVINSLGHGHTHTQTRIPTIRTGSILRNQAHAGLWPACAWLKTEKKNLLNSMALFASSVALASPKWTVFSIKLVFLDVSY